jgi:hypothetical protein
MVQRHFSILDIAPTPLPFVFCKWPKSGGYMTVGACQTDRMYEGISWKSNNVVQCKEDLATSRPVQQTIQQADRLGHSW